MRASVTVARHTLVYASGSVAGGVTRAILVPVISRMLTTSEYGVFSLLLAVTNLLHLVFEMGFVTALIRFHHRTTDEAERQRLRSAVFLAVPVADMLIVVPCLLAAAPISRVLFGTAEHALGVSLAVGTAFFAAQFQLFLGHLRADDRSRDFAVLMGIKGAVTLSITLYLVLGRGMGVPGFLLGGLAGPAAVAVMAIPRLLVKTGVDLRGAGARLRDMAGFGFPLVPSALGLWMLTYLDVYFLRILGDLSQVGVYQYGAELCLPLVLVITSLSMAWPSFSFSRAREADGPETIAQVFRHLFVVLVGVALGIALLRGELLSVLGTEAYAASGRVIPLLALASVFYGASQVFSTGLQVAGKTRVMPKVILAAALGNAALNLALIPQLHEVGAALATAITNLLLCAGMLVGSRRVFPIPFETGRLLRIVVTAGFLLFCGDALGALPLAAGIAARVGLLALFGPMLVLSGGISRGELRSVPGVLGTIIGGDR